MHNVLLRKYLCSAVCVPTRYCRETDTAHQYVRGVQAVERQKFVVRAQLLHPALVEHGDLVGVADGGQPVRHRQGRALLSHLQLVQGRLDLRTPCDGTPPKPPSVAP